MKLTAPKTKTNQILDFFTEKIGSGILRPGEKLDSMRTLSSKFSVSTTTIRQVFDELENLRMIRSENSGRDVFVTDPRESAPRFLIVTMEQKLESPAQYIIPEFSAICRTAGSEIDTVLTEFLRNPRADEILEELKSRHYSGVLLMNSNYNGGAKEKEVPLLHRLNIPVLIGHTSNPPDTEETGFASLYLNESNAWEMAKEHLRSIGCRRIGGLGYRGSYRGETKDLAANLSTMLDDSFDAVFTPWFRTAGPFDAVLCYSDFQAIRVYDWCRRNRIGIPEDLCVMGICGYPGGGLLRPSLSTVDFRYKEFGRLAAETLLKAAGGTLPPDRIEIFPEELIRESTNHNHVGEKK